MRIKRDDAPQMPTADPSRQVQAITQVYNLVPKTGYVMWALHGQINRKVTFHLTKGFSELQDDLQSSFSCKPLLASLSQTDLK